MSKTKMWFKNWSLLFGCSLIACVGCGDTPANGPPSNGQSGTPAGVVQVIVEQNGRVLVNSEEVAIDSLGAKFDEIGNVKTVWYHRESPETAEPHENALKVIQEVAQRKYAIALYLDREFTKPMSMGP